MRSLHFDIYSLTTMAQDTPYNSMAGQLWYKLSLIGVRPTHKYLSYYISFVPNCIIIANEFCVTLLDSAHQNTVQFNDITGHITSHLTSCQKYIFDIKGYKIVTEGL